MNDEQPAATWSLTELVAAALAGDATAWQLLVRRLERVVWKAVNMMTTDNEVRDDAFAATWLRLTERLGSVREPEKLPGWLATTATNEVRTIVRHRSRQHVSIDAAAPADLFRDLLGGGDHDRDLVRSEASTAVRQAFLQLDEDCRQILTVLVLTDPAPSYREASEMLARPIGALGPSRGRCLEKLRALPAVQQMVNDRD